MTIVFVVAGCTLLSPKPGPYVPQVAGIVVSMEPAGGNLTRYTLENGGTFTVNEMDGNAYTNVYSAGQAIGDLLLAGHASGRPWLALIPPASLTRSDLPDGCYELNGWGTDEGDWIQADIGLKLKKAADFDPGLLPETPDRPVPTAHPGLRYEGALLALCLNDEGLVTAAR